MSNDILQGDASASLTEILAQTHHPDRLRRTGTGDGWIGTLMNDKHLSDERMRGARRSFGLLLIYTFATGILMVVAALAYLSTNGPLNATIVIATTLGVFFSVVLGAGLMALGFLSANSGHDDRAAAHVHHDAPSA